MSANEHFSPAELDDILGRNLMTLVTAVAAAKPTLVDQCLQQMHAGISELVERAKGYDALKETRVREGEEFRRMEADLVRELEVNNELRDELRELKAAKRSKRKAPKLTTPA